MNRLKLLRKQKNMTQAELASFIGINQNTYSYWENDKVSIDSNSVLKLANFFNVSTDYLLCSDEKKTGASVDEPAEVGLQKKKLLNELEKCAAILDEDNLLKVLGYAEGLAKNEQEKPHS